jgi:hypothetical protein
MTILFVVGVMNQIWDRHAHVAGDRRKGDAYNEEWLACASGLALIAWGAGCYNDD